MNVEDSQDADQQTNNETGQQFDPLRVTFKIITDRDWHVIQHLSILALSSTVAAVMYFYPIPLEFFATKTWTKISQAIFPLVIMGSILGLLRSRKHLATVQSDGVPDEYKSNMDNYTTAMLVFQFSVMLSLWYSIFLHFQQISCMIVPGCVMHS